MRLRLERFDGLRVALPADWYELPSHLEADERVRLQGLLAAATGCREVLECEWHELAALRGAALTSTLIHVAIPPPPALAHEARRAALREHSPRLGLFTVMDDVRWPERAWDELEVKGPLATWLRQNFKQSAHPLAGLGVAGLPVDALIAATTEPIELLALVEMTLELGSRERAQKGAIDWQRCVEWSIGRRLAARLHRAAPVLRPALARAIAAAPDGPLPPLLEPRVRDELARLGLAHVSAGDAVLVPLARFAAEARVAALLELEGVHEPAASEAAGSRSRARDVHEAAQAFDPLITIGLEDPWFVDLRALARRFQGFAERLRRLVLHGRGAYARVVVLQRPRSGADTMVRRVLFEAQREGLVTVSSRIAAVDPAAPIHFADLLLGALRSLLEWCGGAPTVALAPELLAELRRWLASIALVGEEREYFMRGAGVAEHVRDASLIVLIRRAAEADRASEVSERLLGATQELFDHLCAVIRAIQEALASRGSKLCLRFEGLDFLNDPKRIDALVLARGSEFFQKIPCDVLLGLHLVAEFAPGRPLRASELFSALIFPEAPAADEPGEDEARAITRALLGARADLGQIFGEHEVQARVAEIAAACGGEPFDTLALARAACGRAQGGVVTAAAVEDARRAMAVLAASEIPDGLWGDIEAPKTERAHGFPAFLQTQCLVPRDGEGWAPRALLRGDPRLLAARLRRTGKEAAASGDVQRAEADLRASFETLERVQGTAVEERALSGFELGNFLIQQSRIADAEHVLSLVVAEAKAGDTPNFIVQNVSICLALVLRFSGRPADALEAAGWAWENRDPTRKNVDLHAGVIYASVLVDTGNMDAADGVLREIADKYDTSSLPEAVRAMLDAVRSRVAAR